MTVHLIRLVASNHKQNVENFFDALTAGGRRLPIELLLADDRNTLLPAPLHDHLGLVVGSF